MADRDELRKELAEIRAATRAKPAMAQATKTKVPTAPAPRAAEAAELAAMIDRVNERRYQRLAREFAPREERYQRATGGTPPAPYFPIGTVGAVGPYQGTAARQGAPAALPRTAGGVSGLAAPRRDPGSPWERFMEESVYPPFDRFGRQVPFWSPLMSIGEVGQGNEWWTWEDYWNELMRSPRATRDRIMALIREQLRR